MDTLHIALIDIPKWQYVTGSEGKLSGMLNEDGISGLKSSAAGNASSHTLKVENLITTALPKEEVDEMIFNLEFFVMEALMSMPNIKGQLAYDPNHEFGIVLTSQNTSYPDYAAKFTIVPLKKGINPSSAMGVFENVVRLYKS